LPTCLPDWETPPRHRQAINVNRTYKPYSPNSNQLPLTAVTQAFPGLGCGLPARLHHAGQVSLERLLPETDAAEAKPAHIPPRTAAHGAAVAHAHSIFPVRLANDHGLLSHNLFPFAALPRVDGLAALKRHVHQGQQPTRFLIRVGSGHNRNFHPPDLVNLVVVNFRKDQLLAQAQAVIATAVE